MLQISMRSGRDGRAPWIAGTRPKPAGRRGGRRTVAALSTITNFVNAEAAQVRGVTQSSRPGPSKPKKSPRYPGTVPWHGTLARYPGTVPWYGTREH